jgi:hypothetical protein
VAKHPSVSLCTGIDAAQRPEAMLVGVLCGLTLASRDARQATKLGAQRLNQAAPRSGVELNELLGPPLPDLTGISILCDAGKRKPKVPENPC